MFHVSVGLATESEASEVTCILREREGERERERVTWCFASSQPVRLYQRQREREKKKKKKKVKKKKKKKNEHGQLPEATSLSQQLIGLDVRHTNVRTAPVTTI